MFDLTTILGGTVGGVLGGGIALLFLPWVIRRGQEFEREARERQERRLNNVEAAVAAIAANCERCGPTVRRHDEALKNVNAPLIEERIRRSLELGLALEAKLAPVPGMLVRMQTTLEDQVVPEVKDLRAYIRNVSRKSDQLDHELDRRICRLEGRPPPAALAQEEPEEDEHAA